MIHHTEQLKESIQTTQNVNMKQMFHFFIPEDKSLSMTLSLQFAVNNHNVSITCSRYANKIIHFKHKF